MSLSASVWIHRAGFFIRTPRVALGRLAEKVALRYLAIRYKLPTIGLEEMAPTTDRVDPPILEGICLPPYIAPDDHDDYAPLMRIAKSCAPAIILELGTAYGNTVANLCHELPKATVYTVNALPSQQTGSLVTWSLTEQEIGRVFRQYGFADRVKQLLTNTIQLDLSSNFDQPLIDLAIIDACHDTEYVVNDFCKVKDYVRPGGLILFHDTHPSMQGHLIGSYRACLLLRRRGFDVRHIAKTWWGIWRNTSHTN